MLPVDFTLIQGLAIALLFAPWFCYSMILNTISRGSLNRQLSIVRMRWLKLSVRRAQKPFDAILLGHIVNSIAFFGSATLIVMAGLATLFVNVKSVYGTTSELLFVEPSSLALFVIHVIVLTVVLTLSFFSFTYALRKMIYVLALVGALPEGQLDDHEDACRSEMVESAATVLSEALVTFNFGIRGYYYAVASLGLFVSPWLCIGLSFLMTAILMYRQIATTTSAAVQKYVDLSNKAMDGRKQD